MKISVVFDPRNWWVGVYFNRKRFDSFWDQISVYVCIIFCLPIILQWKVRRR